MNHFFVRFDQYLKLKRRFVNLLPKQKTLSGKEINPLDLNYTKKLEWYFKNVSIDTFRATVRYMFQKFWSQLKQALLGPIYVFLCSRTTDKLAELQSKSLNSSILLFILRFRANNYFLYTILALNIFFKSKPESQPFTL